MAASMINGVSMVVFSCLRSFFFLYWSRLVEVSQSINLVIPMKILSAEMVKLCANRRHLGGSREEKDGDVLPHLLVSKGVMV